MDCSCIILRIEPTKSWAYKANNESYRLLRWDLRGSGAGCNPNSPDGCEFTDSCGERLRSKGTILWYQSLLSSPPLNKIINYSIAVAEVSSYCSVALLLIYSPAWQGVTLLNRSGILNTQNLPHAVVDAAKAFVLLRAL
jgi:hypothetical protein